MKKFGFMFIGLFVAVSSFAQTDDQIKEDPRYGSTPEERVETVKKISIYSEYVKTNNYKDAYEQGWKEVFENTPLATVNLYTHGARILHSLYTSEKDADKKAEYSAELMKVYEQRLKYLDQLNAQSQSKATEADVYGQYAHDYITYNPKPSLKQAYELLRKAVDLGKGATQYYVLEDLVKISAQRFSSNKENQDYRDALIQDYLDCSAYIDEFIAAQTKENVLENAHKTKENIDGRFVKSGAADCESLQTIYGPKIEANKDNLEYLNKVVNIMYIFDCRSSDAYFAAAEYAHAISPSVKTAKSLGALYLKQRDDMDKALEFYQQAIDLDEDKISIGDTYYTMAQLWLSKENYDRCRTCLNKCISNNPNKGDAYILLGQLYAIKHQWSNDPALNKCAYFAVLDKFEQAKRVDPSVAEKANSLIKDYSKQVEGVTEDLFMLGIKAGDKIEIKGWINETTTIR